jgi:hypothetical protein
MRVMSKRRRGELRVRAVVRAEVLGRDGGCVARDRLPQVDCSGPLDVHELVCRNHHSWCHDHPLEARNLGLLRLAHEAGE